MTVSQFHVCLKLKMTIEITSCAIKCVSINGRKADNMHGFVLVTFSLDIAVVDIVVQPLNYWAQDFSDIFSSSFTT